MPISLTFPASVKKKALQFDDVESRTTFLSKWIGTNESITHEEALGYYKDMLLDSEIQYCPMSRSLVHVAMASRMYHLAEFDNSIKHAQKSIDSMESINTEKADNRRVSCYSIIGADFQSKGDYKNSLFSLKKGATILRKGRIKPNVCASLYNDIASLYFYIHDLDSSESYFNLAESELKKLDEKTYLNSAAPIYANWGDIFLERKDLIKAEELFRKALKLLSKGAQKQNYPNVLVRLACVLTEQKKYKAAEKELLRAIQIGEETQQVGTLYTAHFRMGENFLKLEDNDKALHHFETARNYASQVNANQMEAAALKEIAAIYEISGEDKKAIGLFKKHHELHIEILKNELTSLREENQKTIEKLRVELETVKYIEDNKRLNLDLSHKNRALTSKALQNAINHKFLDETLTIVKNGRKNSLSHMQSTLKVISDLIVKKMNQTTDFTFFEKRFNEYQPEFLEKFQGLNLTAADFQFCVLIKMGMDTYEIAEVLSITNRAVQQRRYRLKKKLGIKTDISAYILSL